MRVVDAGGGAKTAPPGADALSPADHGQVAVPVGTEVTSPSRQSLLSGLTSKVVGAVSIVAVAMAWLLSGQATSKLSQNLEGQLESKGEAIATALAFSLSQNASVALSDKVSSVQALIDASKTIAGVSYVYIQDWEGSILVHTFEPHFPAEFVEANWIKPGDLGSGERVKILKSVRIDTPKGPIEAIDVAAPIAGGKLGVVHVGMDQTVVQKQASVLRSSMIRWGAGVALLGILLIVLIVSWFAIGPIHRMTTVARCIASGDLAPPEMTLLGSDEMSEAFRVMLHNLRTLVSQIQDISVQMNSSSTQVFTTARQQQLSASQQAGVIEQTRRTMDSLLESSRAIAESAEGVLKNAESTLGTNRLIAQRNDQLFAHVHRIAEILELIKDIANKSDLLALNAALEGTKAGEAGRGFSLVAVQMQRLAENVMGAVQEIKRVVADVTAAGQAAVLATEEGTRLSELTTQSARQIRLITQQQQTGTEQVSRSMDGASQQLSDTVSGIADTTQAMKALTELSEQLGGRLGAFKLD
jgi:methyl-accepting chemotaxis protein